MGALLVFQPTGDAAGPDAFGRARACIENTKGLAVAGETAHAVKYLRRNGSGSALARSDRGWLAVAGDWEHPDAADATALLSLLEARGAAGLDDLDGFYAVAWQDGDTLTVATDHFGRLHVFAAEAPEGVYVSTSATALGAAVPGGPDPDGVWEFLTTGTFYEERTVFAGVRRLLGARRYTFRGGRPAGVDLAPSQLVPGRGEPSAPADAAALDAACRTAVRRFVPEGCNALADLTGGLDSRLVVGQLVASGLKPVVTVAGAPTDPDVVVAHRLARVLGLEIRHRKRTELSFEDVLRAAARVDGEYDAVEYAGIASVHEAHAQEFTLSVNGSGGEVYRNYWWDRNHLGRTDGDSVGDLLRRFLHAVNAPPFVAPRDPAEHFRAVLGRELEGRAGDPLSSVFDHAYLYLRMQCWQGAIASATNELWSNVSPLMLRRPLEVLYRVPDEQRLDNRLVFDLIGRLAPPLRTARLATGFPPLRCGAGNWWRFVPGWLGYPRSFLQRVRGRLMRGKPDATGARRVQALMAGGAGDYLDPGAMKLLPLLDRPAYERFLARARSDGAVPVQWLGRLIAIEHALRA